MTRTGPLDTGKPSRRRHEPAPGLRIARLFAPHRSSLLLACTLILVAVLLSSTGPLLLQRVLNDALPRHRSRLLGELCAAMLLTSALATAVSVLQGMLTNSIGQRVVHDLRVLVYDRVHTMPLNFFAVDANSEVQSRLVNDIGGINEILTFTIPSVVAAVVSFVTAAVVMMILSWPLAVASIALAIGLNLFNQRFTERRRRLAKRNQEHAARMLQLISEDLAMPGIILGRTLRRTHAQRSRFEDLSHQIRAVTYKQRLAGRTSISLITLTMASLPPIVFWLSGTLVPGISLGTAVVVATMQIRLAGPVQMLLALNGRWQSSRAMFDRIFEYLDLNVADEANHQRHTSALPSEVPSLVLQGISYHYPNADQAAVFELDAEFEPCSLTVIAGHSGCGKSTAALLLSGLIEADSGEVLVDGVPTDAGRLRDIVTLVPQDCFLFNASLRENLLFAAPTADQSDLAGAITAASLSALVERLPDGLDTPVGERGFQLSGGERQRVALARALLADHRILVVDEATSALDGVTANEIHQRLRTWSTTRTVIVIAHRIPQAHADDRVLVMDRGRIIEQGRHEDLVARHGAFHELVSKQSVLTGF